MLYIACIVITILAGFTSGLVQKHLIARYILAIFASLAALGSLIPATEASLRAQDPCTSFSSSCNNEGVILFCITITIGLLSIGLPYLLGDYLSKRSNPPVVGGNRRVR